MNDNELCRKLYDLVFKYSDDIELKDLMTLAIQRIQKPQASELSSGQSSPKNDKIIASGYLGLKS